MRELLVVDDCALEVIRQVDGRCEDGNAKVLEEDSALVGKADANRDSIFALFKAETSLSAFLS